MDSELKALIRRLISKRECKEETTNKAREKFYIYFKRAHSKINFLKKLDDFLRQCSTINSYDNDKIDIFRTELDCAVSTCVEKIKFNFCSQDFYKLGPVKETPNLNSKQKKRKKGKVEGFVDEVQNLILKKKIQDLKQTVGFYKMKYEMIEYRIQKFVSTCLITQLLEKKISQNKNFFHKIFNFKKNIENEEITPKKRALEESCDYLLSSIKKKDNNNSDTKQSNLNRTAFLTISHDQSLINSAADENLVDLSYNCSRMNNKKKLQKLVENMKMNLIQTKHSERNYKRKYESLKKTEEENFEKITMLERELSKNRDLNFVNQSLSNEIQVLKNRIKSIQTHEKKIQEINNLKFELQKAENEIESLRSQLKHSDMLIKDLNEINMKNETELKKWNLRDEKSSKSLFNAKNSGFSHIYHQSHESNEYNHSCLIEQLKEALSDSQTKIMNFENEISDMNGKIENFENEIFIKNDHLTILQNELSLAKREVSYLERGKKMNELAQENIKKLENEVSVLKENGKKVRELLKKIDQKDREIQNLKKSLDKVRVESKREINTELIKVKKELKEVKEVVSGENQLITLYELSQREIEHIDEELKKAWRLMKSSNKTYKFQNAKIDKENKRLRKMLEINKKELTMLKLKVSSLQRQNSMLSREIDKPRIDSAEVIELMEKIAFTKNQAKIKDFTSENDSEFLNEINRLNSKMASMEKINKNLHLDLEKSEKEMMELSLYKDKFKNLEELIFKEREEQKKEVNDLKQRVNQLHIELDTKQNAIVQLEETNKKLEENSLSPEIKKKAERIMELNSIRKSMKFENPENEFLSDSEGKRRPLGQMNIDKLDLSEQDMIKALKEELDYMTRLKDKFASKLHEARKELSFAAQEKEEAIIMKKEIEKEILELSKENEQVKDEKVEYINSCEELMQKVASFHAENEKLKTEICKLESLKEEIGALEKCLNEARDQMKAYKKNYQGLLQHQNLKQREENNVVYDLNNVIANLREDIERRKEKNEDLKRDFDNVVARCEELGERCFAAMNEINEKKSEIEEQELKIERYEKEEKKLFEERIFMLKEVETLKKDNKKLGKEIGDLKHNLKNSKNEFESKQNNNILIEENKYIGDSELISSHIRLESFNNSSNAEFSKNHLIPKNSTSPKRNQKKTLVNKNRVSNDREKYLRLQEEIIRSSLGVNQVSTFDSQEKDFTGFMNRDFSSIHLVSDNSLVEIIIRDSAKKYFLEHINEKYDIILRDRSLIETPIRGMSFEVSLNKLVNQKLLVSENFKEEENISNHQKPSPGTLFHSSFAAYECNDFKSSVIISGKNQNSKENKRKNNPLSIMKMNLTTRKESIEEEEIEILGKYQSKESDLSLPTNKNSQFNSTLKGSICPSEDEIDSVQEERITPCIAKLEDCYEEKKESHDQTNVTSFKKKDHVKYLIHDRVENSQNEKIIEEKFKEEKFDVDDKKFQGLKDVKYLKLISPQTSQKGKRDDEMEKKKKIIQSGLLEINLNKAQETNPKIPQRSPSNQTPASPVTNYQSFGNFQINNNTKETKQKESETLSERIKKNLITIKQENPIVFKNSQPKFNPKMKKLKNQVQMSLQPAQIDKTKQKTENEKNNSEVDSFNIFHAIQIDSRDKLSRSFFMNSTKGSGYSNNSKFLPKKATLRSSNPKIEENTQVVRINREKNYLKTVQNSGDKIPVSNKFRKYSNSPKSFSRQTAYQKIIGGSSNLRRSKDKYRPQKVAKGSKVNKRKKSKSRYKKNYRVYEVSPQRATTKIQERGNINQSSNDNYDLMGSVDQSGNFNFKKKSFSNLNKVVISSKISVKSKNSGDMSSSNYSNFLKKAIFSGESKLDLSTLKSSRSKSSKNNIKNTLCKSFVYDPSNKKNFEKFKNVNKSIELRNPTKERNYDKLNLLSNRNSNLTSITNSNYRQGPPRSLSLKNQNQVTNSITISRTEGEETDIETKVTITPQSTARQYTNLYPSQEYGRSNNQSSLGSTNQFLQQRNEGESYRTRRSPYESRTGLKSMKENDSSLTNKKQNKLTLRYGDVSTQQKEKMRQKSNVLFDSEFVKSNSRSRSREAASGGRLRNRVLNVRPNFDMSQFN